MGAIPNVALNHHAELSPDKENVREEANGAVG